MYVYYKHQQELLNHCIFAQPDTDLLCHIGYCVVPVFGLKRVVSNRLWCSTAELGFVFKFTIILLASSCSESFLQHSTTYWP